MEPSDVRRSVPQLVLGLLIVCVGVLLTLDTLGIADADRLVWRLWPIGLIAIGLAKLWQSKGADGGLFAGLLLTAVGTWLLLDQLGIVTLSFWRLWPMVLVALGASLVWRSLTGRRPAPHDSNSIVSAVAVLSGVSRGNNSSTFRGGDLTALMGGCEVDLRKAQINGEAVLDVFAMWGGIELRVPEDWTVIGRVTPLLGGYDDKTRPTPGASPHTLIVRGFVIMGGVEVKN